MSEVNRKPYVATVSVLIYFLPVLFGGLIYYMLRPEPIVFYSWLDYFNLKAPFFSIRLNLIPSLPSFPSWFKYSLPSGLWAFSYTAIILFLWGCRSEKIKYFWFFTIPVVCLSYELLQYAGLVKGTFCTTDLAFCFFGMLLGLTNFKVRRWLT